jgi:peptide/nickel transport system permease protein
MTRYILKRILAVIPTLLGITLVTFFMIKLAPGDPVSQKLGLMEGVKAEQVSPQVIEDTKRLYGLIVDLPPWYENFIHKTTLWIHGSDPRTRNQEHWTRSSLAWLGQSTVQYLTWLKRLASFNFGVSTKDSRPVSDKILEALPITLTLNVLSIILIYLISVPLGVYSATRHGKAFDKFSMLVLFILYSLPNFWVATLLLMYFSVTLDMFPLTGWISEGAENFSFFNYLIDISWHLFLPLVTLVYGGFAFLSRFTRTNLLEVIRQDYIRTAWAKGLSQKKVIWKHAFRNSLIALVTLMGTLLPSLLGGSIIVEEIFSIPGMGRLGFESILARDLDTIMAIATISAVLTLISLLLSDIAYAWVDPRISFEKREAS